MDETLHQHVPTTKIDVGSPEKMSKDPTDEPSMPTSTDGESRSLDGMASSASKSNKKTVISMAALTLSVFLVALDQTIITTALPTIATDFTASEDHGMYIGFIALAFAVASSIGPILGGIFTQLITWRWCFYVNLPLDGAAFLAIFFFLNLETPRTPIIAGLKTLDLFGSLLIVGGTIVFLLGLEFGGVIFPWNSATVICLIIFGLILLSLFFVWEWKFAKYPLIPMQILTNRSNVAALLTNFLHGFVFISGSYFLPLYFQAVLAMATGIFIRKTGQFLPPIWLGTSFMTLGSGLLIGLPIYPSWTRVVIYQIIAGIGVRCLFQAPLIALHSHLPPRDITSATVAFGFMRNFSTAVSVVVGSVIFQDEMTGHVAALNSTLPPTLANALKGGTVVAAFIAFLVSLTIAKKHLETSHTITKTGLDVQEKDRLERIMEDDEKRKGKVLEKMERASESRGAPAELLIDEYLNKFHA
ncbi:hypothetical protein G7Y89_g1658 [Cudoniella acicularis]|uniref:Major facilitator superfamily (MFS) profile domain-containing protein n=1 Tax=Cudoniella acicularis TaxID=354080 RepID=A0A8H4W6S6_9HELO|nr:hypothetical protein G7Y89_g1658 [Cudoniella acicularis]